MSRIWKALAASFIALAMSGYTIKETKSNTDLDLYVSPSGTPAKAVSVSGTSGVLSVLFGQTFDLAATPADITARRANTSLASPSVVSSGNQISRIFFKGYDGAAYLNAAQINTEIDGTPGSNDMPGRIIFRTTADGGADTLERMRITSTGLIDLSQGTSAGIKLPNGGGTLSTFASTAACGTGNLVPSGGSFTSVTYNTADCRYARVGPMTYINLHYNWSAASVGSASGNLRQVLPVAGVASIQQQIPCYVEQYDLSGSAVRHSVFCSVYPGASFCDFIAMGDAVAGIPLDPTLMGSGGFNKQIICTGFYFN